MQGSEGWLLRLQHGNATTFIGLATISVPARTDLRIQLREDERKKKKKKRRERERGKTEREREIVYDAK